MARYTEASCKLCRRESVKLFLKGSRCITDKCAFTRRGYAPGQHGQKRVKLSGYGIQLREKQKAKRIYGLLERQFRHYFAIAERSKGITGEVLLQLLERRLDNVIFRLCFASSRAQARQIVNHGWVAVNGRKVDIPSYLVKEGDSVELRRPEEKRKWCKDIIEINKERGAPAWLDCNFEAMKGAVKRLPVKNDIGFAIQEQLIVELYSK